MAERVDASIRTWKQLIHVLAARYHDGHYYPMAARVQVSAGLVDQWKRGVVKAPSLDSILKVCAAYNLEFLDVVRFGAPGKRRPTYPIGGGSGDDGTPLVAWWEGIVPLIRRWWRTPWGPGLVWAPAP